MGNNKRIRPNDYEMNVQTSSLDRMDSAWDEEEESIGNDDNDDDDNYGR